MTHGDKAKAKAGRKSQTSAPGRSEKSGANGKGGHEKAGSKSSKAAVVKKVAAAEEGSRHKTAASKERAAGAAATRSRSGSDADGIGDPIVAAAFKHAVKKYPNAFRRLTD